MTPGIRVIRFARAERSTHPLFPAATLVARVFLDERPVEAGLILRSDHTWDYVQLDGTPSGLRSLVSRQDLEGQIALYHLGPLPVASTGGAESLKLAM